MSSGARTPPDVPEPSATAQTTPLVTASEPADAPVSFPRSRSWIVP